MSLEDPGWHIAGGIPRQSGWYFIRTTAPVDILKEQALWDDTYLQVGSGKTVPVKNYDIASRAARFSGDLADCWNVTEVYSGLASNLRDRAREHTFPNPGTAALALSRYPALRAYEWTFGFVTMKRFLEKPSCETMLLRLGEQIWRSKNGWPLLCEA